MPALAAGASAVGSAIGGIASGKGAKKAAKIQAKASAAQTAAAERNRDYQYKLNAPTIDQGAAADTAISGLLNIGGDPAASEKALTDFRSTGGYQELMRTGLGAVNSNAYAKGMGDSGATLKALQDRGAYIADSSRQGYLGQLAGVSGRGGQARGLVAGIGSNTVGAVNQATQSSADASGNAAIVQNNALVSGIQGLLNAGASALGSSYKPSSAITGGGGGNSFAPTFSQPYNPLIYGGLNQNWA